VEATVEGGRAYSQLASIVVVVIFSKLTHVVLAAAAAAAAFAANTALTDQQICVV